MEDVPRLCRCVPMYRSTEVPSFFVFFTFRDQMPVELYRHFIFTAFKEPKIDVTSNKIGYYIFQQEETPTTKKGHWQGYIELQKSVRMRLDTIKRQIFHDNTIHIERRIGPQTDAINYCKKKQCEPECLPGCRACCAKVKWAEKGLRVPDTSVTVWGEKSGIERQGERNDIEVFMDEAKSGASLGDLMQTSSNVCAKYHAFCREFVIDQQMRSIPPWRFVNCTVYWGHTGMGKTRRIFYEHPDVYKLDPCEIGKVWWCGYNGEDVLLLDDFYGWIAIGMLLNLLDGYKVRLQIKGSFTYAAWTKVYITSNVSPSEWYKGNEFGFNISQGQRNALERRLSNVVHITSEWTPPDDPTPIADLDARMPDAIEEIDLETLETPPSTPTSPDDRRGRRRPRDIETENEGGEAV